MKIILTAVEETLAWAWEQACGDLDFVTISRESIIDLACDAVVSPANSFGFMDGGVDAVYSHHFGWHVQERLQTLIRSKHQGELLVGAAEIVETDNLRIPFLIAAPTMRVPLILRDSAHAYLAARAVFLLIQNGRFSAGPLQGERVTDAVQSVAFPGLGTGVGRMPPEICARQMRAAIDEFVLGKQTFPESWYDAQQRHQKLYSDRTRDLQFGEAE